MGNTQTAELEEVIIQNTCLMDRHLPSGETLLTACIQEKNVKIIKKLLSENVVDTNFTNVYGDTPLLVALRTKNMDIIWCVLDQARTDVNKVGRFQISPIQLAVLSEDQELVKLLLSKGANPDGFCFGTKYEHPKNYSTPLQIVINNKDISKILIDHGASVNIGCPLKSAIEKKSFAVAKEIINNKDLDIDHLNKQRFDVLAAAAKVHNCSLLRDLLVKGLVIRKSNDGCKKEKSFYNKEVGPLGYIIHYGCWDCFQHMLKYVTDLDQKDMLNLTMLDYALFINGWNCSKTAVFGTTKDTVHTECVRRGYNIHQSVHVYKPSSFRLRFIKELLNRGADLSDVWNKGIWSYTLKSSNEFETEGLHFCIRAYHSDNEIKQQSMFRNMACISDMKALALVYLDGYYPTKEDITIAENRISKTANNIDIFENSSFEKDKLDNLRFNARSLTNLSVVTIRKSIGPNIYRPVQTLPIPQPLKKLILLENISGMIPRILTNSL